MQKPEMSTFIQALYGSVLGVSFYKITIPSTGQIEIVENVDELISFFWSQSALKLSIFILTLLIVAHDWFSFHKYKNLGLREHNYWAYVPQIFSIFFISQMFVAADAINLQYWYAFGFWYTISNIINYCLSDFGTQQKKEFPLFDKIKYLIHLSICSFFFFAIEHYWLKPTVIPVVITAAIVFTLWIVKEKLKRAQPKTNSPNLSQENEIEKYEEESQKLREKAYNMIKRPVGENENELNVIELKITEAQNLAKTKRKEYKDEFEALKIENKELKIKIAKLENKPID